MKLNKRVEDVLNKQINAELWSAYLYLSMSTYLESEGLSGFANWMRVQYQEETSHAMKILDYVNERSGRVILEPIAEVPTAWKNVEEVFQATYDHECHVSELINNCVTVAMEEKDYATSNMLQWFVDEQVEEEANASELLDQLKMLGGAGHGLFMMNKELAARVFVDATQKA